MIAAEAPTRADRTALLTLLKEKERRLARRKLLTYFPDEGPLRRDLYRQHLEFFRLGATVPTRCFMAANRVGKCISHDTVIECPDGTERKVGEIKGPHLVWAWDGQKRVPAVAEAPFMKPSEMVYRVWLSTGQWFDCAAEHRLLTVSGWSFFSDLAPCVPSLPASSSALGLIGSLEDARRWLRTPQGSAACCAAAARSGDGQPLCASEAGQVSSPSPSDARRHSLASCSSDDLARIGTRSLSRLFGHLSSLCGQALSAARFAASSVRSLCSIGQLCLDSPQASLRSCGVEALDPQRDHATQQDQERSFSLVSPDGSHNSIVCYQAVSVQPIYDFTVPGLHNYCTRGAVHHNTEGGGGYELTLHLTGRYPEWWQGRRFVHSTDAWAAGDTNETVRDIIQLKLMGREEEGWGTGLIPSEDIVRVVKRQNGNGAVDFVEIRNAFGGTSRLGFKSYEQGRKAFQGTEKHVIWLDEESEEGIRSECALRLMTTNGLLMETFTPLRGLTPIVLKYLNDDAQVPENRVAIKADRAMVMAGWDDVPHLDEAQKTRMMAEAETHLREARSKGVPSLGSGAIYPVAESEIVVDPFEIPAHWPRAYGLDVGWKRTAAIWGALDRETDVLYLYSEHYQGEAEPSTHVAGINGRGKWIPGTIDPASRGRSQKDGEKLFEIYTDLGLFLVPADNSRESGLFAVHQRLASGRLKVFKTLRSWLGEYRIYRRDEKGQIVKENDHLMDGTRYLVVSGIDIAKTNASEDAAAFRKSRGYDDR